MSKLSFLIPCIVLFLFLPVFAVEKTPPPADPPLIPSEFVWLFGYIPDGAWVNHHYVLHNPHSDAVTILSLAPGCDCTHVPKTPIVIPPGKSHLLEVQFDTRTYFGETNRDVHVVTNYKPNPEMDLYFGSVAARAPGSVTVEPSSTAFIPGKDSQAFAIRNLTDETTQFRLYLDNDSSLTLSEDRFTLSGKGEKTVTVSPRWEKFPTGSSYSSLVLEVVRAKSFRVTIPIKVNKF